MKKQNWFRFFSGIIICLMLISVAGCIPPDRWPVFQENFLEERVADEPTLLPPRREALPFSYGQTLELSVEQAALLALSNNRDLQVQQINPVIAGTFEQIERGIYDSELFAEFDLVREKNIDTDNITGDSVTVEDRSFNTLAGIRQKLPSGTDIEAVIEHERLTSDTDPEEQRARHGISITQALLRGFGPAVNLAGVRQAALGFAISRYELRGFTEALLAEAEIAYWQYVLAKKEIEIFESSLAVTRQQRDDIEAQISVGVLAEIDAAVVRAETARREQALIDAVSLLEERRLRLVLQSRNAGDYKQMGQPAGRTAAQAGSPDFS